MRKIIKIAGNELRAFFYSPVAWLLLTVFMFQVSVAFTDQLRVVLRQQALGGTPIEYSLTARLLTGMTGLFTMIQQNLYLYIPLLTMGLISRERSNGSMLLLYSSPVSAFQVVAGKYLAVMVYGAVMTASLGLVVFFSACVIPGFDLPMALSGLLGIYFLIGAYAAIGLFMSCLTSYQIVAAMGTLAALTCLNFVGSLWQGVPLARDIAYWLSIKGRASVFADGLICSEETGYFLLVILLFLALSVMKIEGHRAKRARIVTATRYTALVATVIALGYVTSRPSLLLYRDMTAGKTQTLAPESRRLLESMEGALTITAHTNILGPNYTYGLPNAVNRNVALFKPYLRFKPDIKMDYLYYYHREGENTNPRFAGMTNREIADRYLKTAGARVKKILALEEMERPAELEAEEYRFFWRLTSDDGRHTPLRLFQDIILVPTENEISAAIKRLTCQPPRVAFATGHGEREVASVGDRDYQAFALRATFRHALVNQGFDVISCPVDGEGDIPADVDVLVIAGSRESFSPAALDQVARFAGRGGNLLVLGEPGYQEILNPVIAPLGARFMDGILLHPDENYSADLLPCLITAEGSALVPGLERPRRHDSRITLPGAAGITWRNDSGWRMTPLLSSPDSGSWRHALPVDLSPGDTLSPGPPAGEVEQAYPTAIALSRPAGDREQRAIIIGDADCFSNAELMMTREGIRSDNFALLTESFRWLSNGEFPVDTARPDPADTRIALTLSSMKWVKGIFSWLFPCCMLAGFLVTRVRRKKH
ncbi:MAG: Gldg family protein [Odoribacteraceae bacterium]|jgi:ABC-2 type transport system permease protein|nr:Gldg family protein [Odoribacteraceae bacterium]